MGELLQPMQALTGECVSASCNLVERHDERLGSIERFVEAHAAEHLRLMALLERLANRPSWWVSLVITTLTSALVYFVVR